MKFGAVFPQTEIGNDPDRIKAYALGVEALGFDYILCYEHILGVETVHFPEQQFIYGHQDAFHEPFVLYSFLAALTQRIEFVTGILILPQRDVRLVAKQAAELSLLSKGRFRLGVGAGWNRAEAESLGTDFSTRGKRMNEQLELLHKLFREPLVNFDGRFHNLKHCGLNPMPARVPPIWVGGSADAVLKRVAKFADGWMPATLPEGKEEEIVGKLRHYLREEGKDPSKFGLDARIVLAKFEQTRWTDEFERWKKFGATHFRVNTMGQGFTEIDQHLEALENFLKVVGEVR